MKLNHLLSIIGVHKSDNNSFYVCDFDITYHNGKTERKNGDMFINSLQTRGKIMSFYEYSELFEVINDKDVMIVVRTQTDIEFIPLDEIFSLKFQRIKN